MAMFSVVRRSDGTEVYRYEADQAIPWVGFEFDTHDHLALGVTKGPSDLPIAPSRITKFAFRGRFTPEEKVAIEVASTDAPDAPPHERMRAAALRAYGDDILAAAYIDLTRADTRAGVQALEAAGLLAAGRAAQILDTPPTDEEAWHG